MLDQGGGAVGFSAAGAELPASCWRRWRRPRAVHARPAPWPTSRGRANGSTLPVAAWTLQQPARPCSAGSARRRRASVSTGDGVAGEVERLPGPRALERDRLVRARGPPASGRTRPVVSGHVGAGRRRTGKSLALLQRLVEEVPRRQPVIDCGSSRNTARLPERLAGADQRACPPARAGVSLRGVTSSVTGWCFWKSALPA